MVTIRGSGYDLIADPGSVFSLDPADGGNKFTFTYASSLQGFGANFGISVDIVVPTPPDHPMFGIWDYIVVESLYGNASGSGSTQFFVFIKPEHLIHVDVDAGAADGGASWSFTLSEDGLGTAPLRFVPTTDTAIRALDEANPFLAYTLERVHVIHENATEGISLEQGMFIDYENGSFSLPGFINVDHYDAATEATRPMFTVTAEEANRFVTFDHVYLKPGEFEMLAPLMLGGLEVIATDFLMNADGVRFGFASTAPEELGSVTFGSSALQPDDYGVLDFNGNLHGPATWYVPQENDVSLLGGAFTGDVMEGSLLRIVPDTTEMQLVGTFAIDSFIGLALTPILFTIDASDRGIWFDGSEGNMDGVMRSASGTTYIIDNWEDSEPVDLKLADLGFDLGDNTDGDNQPDPDYFYVNQVSISLGRNGRHLLNLSDVVSTSWDLRFNPENAIELNSFSVQSNTGGDAGGFVDFNTPMAGAVLDFVSLSVSDLMESVEAPVGLNGIFAFDWRSASGETLATMDLTASLTPSGMLGTAVVSMGLSNELFTGGGLVQLSITDESLIGAIGGTFHLTLIGSIEADEVFFEHAYGPGGKLTGQSRATFDLPLSLKLLFGQATPVDAEIEFAVRNTAFKSLIDTTVTFDSEQYDGEIGFRDRFEGEAEVIGGILMDFVNALAPTSLAMSKASAQSAQSALGESHEFAVPDQTGDLLLAAAGASNASTLRVVDPAGREYTTANFAARGITFVVREEGISLRIPHAEAGPWILHAAGATDFLGFADTPDPELAVEYFEGPNGTVLRFTITGPDQLYDLDILAGAPDDATPPVVQTFEGFRPGTYNIALEDLGLAPGSYRFGGAVSGEGVLSAKAILGAPFGITGVGDLAVSVAVMANPLPENPEDPYEPGVLLIRIANLGTAVAFPGDITLSGYGVLPQGVGRLEAGESSLLAAPLGDFGFDARLPFTITASIAPTGLDADESNHRATASYDPAGGRQTLFYGQGGNLLEDESLTEHPGPAFTIAAQPAHGALEALANGELRYTPDPDFWGVDIGTLLIDGRQTQVWYLVQPANDAPVLGALPAEVEATVGDAFALAIAASDVDAFDVLNLTATQADGSPLPDWLAVDAFNGVLSGMPPVGAPALLNLIVTVSDGNGEEDSAPLAIRIAPPFDGVKVIGTPGPDVLAGGDGNDLIQALAGDDGLDGGPGADTMEGGAGNDAYAVDNAGDRVVEPADGGTDTVRARIDHTLAAHVERLVLVGNGLKGTGNELANHITGSEGADVIDGAAGADTMAGGPGDDSYEVADAGDQVIERAGEGTDTARVAIAEWTLPDHVENAVVARAGGGSLTGNALKNTLTGSDGDDMLAGASGNDDIFGGAGGDQINGGSGRDVLTGGADADRFIFTSIVDAGDVITDFQLGVDQLVIAQLLARVGYAGSDPAGAGYLIATPGAGLTNVMFDIDGAAGRALPRLLVTLNGVVTDNEALLLDPGPPG